MATAAAPIEPGKFDFKPGQYADLHIPGIFTLASGFSHQSELPEKVKLPEKSFVNIGSVGQPRDGDNRSSYVIVDGDAVKIGRAHV